MGQKDASTWSNETWNSFIKTKIEEIASISLNDDIDSHLAPLSTISNPEDPRFPLTIDHTLLKPESTPEQIDKLCDEAIQFGFKQVAERLKGSSSIACSVIGFPLGAGSALAKAEEARQAIADGAKEIDTVIPLGLLLASPPRYAELYQHLRTIIEACHSVPVKVIIETSLLPTREAKIAASVISAEAGAAFVKTSTGFSGGGATVEDVKLMRLATRHKAGVKIKASGGVRTLEACIAMFKAGAERIGTIQM
ncbi:deoxyribose-phosphate aldolase [Coprinopsis cinerea okayama7|uniref:Deoxyribose-phosphate aldolase n=1 Tax=Coprinopsis cinerea (strain Okayama-7 / 130 / ATCC MYA-4618 / FGSC 9003) TaxID=240176 RepID=A8N8I3_COPC7|nr:deoxyribose-phosphate aldolase [Coprinopsis cinerea okayama7\|eukprot:XP_001831139.2 deoxyribose-phosphate aldolase [Coprinopsis cinerea okayama7\